MIKSPIIPFNGAFYTKDGNIHNLDGTSGPGSNASDLMPFTGVFIGSDAKEHDITEILNGMGGGIGSDSELRNKATIMMADPDKYAIARITITKRGTGYVVDDIVTISQNGTTIPMTVTDVDSNGAIKEVSLDYIVSDIDFSTGNSSIVGVGGNGTGSTFHISTSFAIGDVTITGTLEHVPDTDPLVQYSMLIGYVDARLAQLFPIHTDQIMDQAITAAKIDDSAIYPGDGILVTKDDQGIKISAIPDGYEAVTITFYNTDQNGEPI